MRQDILFLSAPVSGHCTKKLTAAGRDIKRIKLRPAETAFVGQICRDRMTFDQRTARRKDLNKRAWSAALPAAHCNDFAFPVETHPLDTAMMPTVIRSECVQHNRMIERAVVTDGICAQLAPLTFARFAVGHVKRLLIWRQ
jgi:hypothetical protein